MKGAYTKRKLKKLKKQVTAFFDDKKFRIRRFFVRRAVKSRDFTIISNNCWAGKVYQYLDMAYLSPTVGLYFFAPDYIKFVSDLHRYLNTPLRFIQSSESKYFDELKRRKQTEKPIALLDDVEIVFLHYSSKEEALEKWNRRKDRINFDNIILKFSRMNLCTEKELGLFDELPFENKILLNNQKPLRYKSEVFFNGDKNKPFLDTEPFPGNINLKKVLNRPKTEYPQCGLYCKKE